MKHDRERLTGGAVLARGVAANVAGAVLPAIAGLIAVPILLKSMGEARFGVLALAWTAVGFFSLFDLGIGRAATHATADRIGRADLSGTAEVVWTSLAVLMPLGVVSALALALAAPWLVDHALKIPLELREETIVALRILSVAIPFTAATAVLRGVLEALQRFSTINALRAPYGVITFLGPVLVLPFSNSLVPSLLVLTLARAAVAVAHYVICRNAVPDMRSARPSVENARQLLSFGGWMTVSNMVSPLMNTFDRFVVASALSVTSVAYYATSNEVVTKMWMFTAAVLPVFFPAFATSAVHDPKRTASLFDRVLRLTFAALFLPTLVLVALAPELLTVWLGAGFAAESSAVLQILAVAVFINTLGQGALTLIQALGRPDITGKYHVLELPLYAGLLWFLMRRDGIVGVAEAWAIRAVLDAVLLLATCPRLLADAASTVRRTFIWLALAVPVLGASALLPTATIRLVAVALAVPAWLLIVWRMMLTESERVSPLGLLAERAK